MVCLELQRGRGRHTSSHRAQRLPQGQSGTFSGGRGHTTEQDMIQKSDAGCLWGIYLSVDLQGMHGIVSLAHKRL